jgi:hypothetical protein
MCRGLLAWPEQEMASQDTATAGDGKSKQRHLGSFVNEVEAALAYDQAARDHHKDKAQLNFPDLPPQPHAALSKTPRETSSQYRGEGRCTDALGSPPCIR